MRPPTRDELSAAWEALGVVELVEQMRLADAPALAAVAAAVWAVCAACLLLG